MPTAPPGSSVGLRMVRGRPRRQIATGKLADFPKRFPAHRPRLRPLGVRPAANKAAYASALRPRRLSIPGSKAIRAFRETFPGVSLVLEEGLSNEVVARFNNNQMDVAFVHARQAHADGVVVTPLREEPMVAALPSRHPMAGNSRSRSFPLKDVRKTPC